MASAAGRITLFVLAGLLAGLLTWLVSDVFVRLSDSVGTLTSREAVAYQIVFMAWGGFVGVLLGVADALYNGTLSGQWPRVVGIGLAVGIVAGVVGGAFGMAIFGPLYVAHAVNPFDFIRNVVARALGWAFIGALAGTTAGWRKWSVRVGRNGLIGGFIGGVLGGMTFEIIPYLMPGIHAGPVSRFFGFLITGALIGLFVALVSELLKEAWVRVVVGRNEGREILVEKAETQIGRSELADIALFGDPNIARVHAVLAGSGGRFAIRDVSQSPVGVVVNGVRITGDQPVRDGDQIQIAGRLLVFHERATQTRTAPAPRDVARSVSSSVGGLRSLSDLPAATDAPRPQSPPAPPAYERTASVSAYLVATDGPYMGTAFPVRPNAVAGRDAGADIALPNDSKASRQHARFVPAGQGFAVEDATSTNGTFVNGVRVTRQTLAPGDTIVIGTTTFRFE